MANTKSNLEEVTTALEKSSHVNVVFGEPITIDNQTGGTIVIIPVAKTFAMGGGGSDDYSDDLESSPKNSPRSGLMARSVPLGYIKVVDGNAEFIEIVDMTGIILKGIFVGGFVSFMLIRMFRKIFG